MSADPASSSYARATAGLVWLAPLVLAQICIHGTMAGTRLAVPLVALGWGVNAATVGLLLALFSLVGVIFSLVVGRWADRYGSRRVLTASAFIASAGAGAVAIYPHLLTMALAAACTGFGTTAGIIALQRYGGRRAHTNEERKVVFSWLAIGPAASGFVGPVLAGFLLDHAGTREVFMAFTVMPLLALIANRYILEEEPVAPQQESAFKSALGLLNEPGMPRLLLINWLLSMSWDVHTFTVPLIGHAQQLAASTIGLVMGCFAVSVVAVRLAIPFLASRLDERRVLSVCMAFTALCFALYPFAKGGAQMGLLSMLLGVFLGSVQPMILSALHALTPGERHGEALGLRNMVMSASGTLMPIVFGSVGAALGAGAVFWLVGSGVAAGSVAARKLPLE